MRLKVVRAVRAQHPSLLPLLDGSNSLAGKALELNREVTFDELQGDKALNDQVSKYLAPLVQRYNDSRQTDSKTSKEGEKKTTTKMTVGGGFGFKIPVINVDLNAKADSDTTREMRDLVKREWGVTTKLDRTPPMGLPGNPTGLVRGSLSGMPLPKERNPEWVALRLQVAEARANERRADAERGKQQRLVDESGGKVAALNERVQQLRKEEETAREAWRTAQARVEALREVLKPEPAPRTGRRGRDKGRGDRGCARPPRPRSSLGSSSARHQGVPHVPSELPPQRGDVLPPPGRCWAPWPRPAKRWPGPASTPGR